MIPLRIADECRQNLNKYSLKAFSVIPDIDKPEILDAGCGTGVNSLALIKECNGFIHAVDPDISSINIFKEKTERLKLTDRITILNKSIFEPELFSFKFDIIIAEGLLNITGFQKGIQRLVNYMKNHSYLIIHDELKNDIEKRLYFKDNNLKLLSSFELNEEIWFKEFYSCIESKLKLLPDNISSEKFLSEINRYKYNSKSIFYILQSKSTAEKETQSDS